MDVLLPSDRLLQPFLVFSFAFASSIVIQHRAARMKMEKQMKMGKNFFLSISPSFGLIPLQPMVPVVQFKQLENLSAELYMRARKHSKVKKLYPHLMQQFH